MAVYKGNDVKVSYDINGVGGAGNDWAYIGQQRGGEFSGSTETADARNKDTNLWNEGVVTGLSWSTTVDGVLDPTDSAWIGLWADWKAGTKVWIQIDYSNVGGVTEEGQAIITGLTKASPISDVVSFSLDLQGDSSWVNSP